MLIQTKKSLLRPIKTMLRARIFFWQIGKYRHIIQNILRIIQECAYPDQNVLIKTHKGYVTSNKKMGKITTKKRAKNRRQCQKAHLNRHARLKRATSLHRCTFLGLYLLVQSDIWQPRTESDSMGYYGYKLLQADLLGRLTPVPRTS